VVLHDRVLRGEISACAELLERMLKRLHHLLRRKYAARDPHVLAQAAEDAVLDYLAQPGVFDPTKGVPLDRFLLPRAERNVQDILRAEASRKDRETRYSGATAPRALNSAGRTRWRARVSVSAILAAAANETDREGLRLMLEGEHQTVVFARALGLSHLPKPEQAREVKRFKDRMLAALRRRFKRDR
jgi:hypothetical protein